MTHGAVACLRTALALAVLASPPAVLAQAGNLKAAFEPSSLILKSGGTATVELRLRNEGTAEAAIQSAFPSADAGLKASTLDGKALAPAAGAAAPALGLDMPDKLKGGGLSSFELDLAKKFPDLAKPGAYKVTWNHPSFPPATLEVTTMERYATIKTNLGEIVIEFCPEEAPKTVANFITLTKKGFYDGLIFHRIIPGFMMQGGCPKGDGTGGPGYTIPAEFKNQKVKHVPGTVSMARKQEPDSAGCQFFICFATPSFLDNQYTIFAQVVRGMDVVKKVEPLGSKSGAPSQKVVMEKVTLSDTLPEEKK